MSNQYFMRVKGRILGPYDQEKLRLLVRRGQLSRMHELSTDGVSWSRATNYPELFAAESDSLQVAVAESSSALQEAAPPKISPASGQGQWYYSVAGNQFGPVDFSQLQFLAGTGQLGGDEQVWTDGMAAWVSPHEVPGLKPQNRSVVPIGTVAIAHGEKEGDGRTLPDSLCKAAFAARPWVMFLAITAFIYAALSVLGGLSLLIAGSNKNAPAVATGLFNLVYGVIAAVGGFLLLSYANHLELLKHHPSSLVLEKGLDAVRAFWIYLSILMIVMLAFIVVVSIWLVAIAETLPWD